MNPVILRAGNGDRPSAGRDLLVRLPAARGGAQPGEQSIFPWPVRSPSHHVNSGRGRTKLATGKAILLAADTAITGGGRLMPCLARSAADCELRDTRVPFVFEDKRRQQPPLLLRGHCVRHQLVPVRSFQSGIAPEHQARIPVASATNSPARPGDASAGRRGTVLSTAGPLPPSIRRTGPSVARSLRPTAGVSAWHPGVPGADRLGTTPDVTAKLDSIQLGSPYQGVAHQYWFTAAAAGSTPPTLSAAPRPSAGRDPGVRTGAGGKVRGAGG